MSGSFCTAHTPTHAPRHLPATAATHHALAKPNPSGPGARRAGRRRPDGRGRRACGRGSRVVQQRQRRAAGSTRASSPMFRAARAPARPLASGHDLLFTRRPHASAQVERAWRGRCRAIPRRRRLLLLAAAGRSMAAAGASERWPQRERHGGRLEDFCMDYWPSEHRGRHQPASVG